MRYGQYVLGAGRRRVPQGRGPGEQTPRVDYMKLSMIGPPLVPPASVVYASAAVTWIVPWKRNVSASMS